MQQGQTQAQELQQSKVQKPKKKRLSRTQSVILICAFAFVVAIIWICSSFSLIPTFLGINSSGWATIITVVVTIILGIFTIVPTLPNDTTVTQETQHPSETPNSPPVSPPTSQIYINIPSSILVPISDTSQTPTTAPSTDYTHMQAVLPATNQRVIQQREAVVKEVYAKLIDDGMSSVALVGIGGIGKSTLAALVRDYAEAQRKLGMGPFEAEAAVFMVDGTTTFLDLASNIFALLKQPLLDFSHYSLQSQANALFHALNTADQPRLIVLDQFENFLYEQRHALTAGAGVGEFLDVLNSQACSCRILLTSRPVPSGTHADLEACRRNYHVSGLTPNEGIALLRSQQIQGTEAELRQAVQRCSGHGLALKLLITLLNDYGVSLSIFLNDPSYIRDWEHDLAAKLLDKIYIEHLKPLARQALQAFCVYREAVPLEAAYALLDSIAADDIRATLRELLRQNLFHIVIDGRYELHPIIANYAQKHFVENDPDANAAALQTAHGKAAHYYLQTAAKQCPAQGKRRSVKDVQPLIEAIWQYCQAALWRHALTLMGDEELFNCLLRWGENTLLIDLCSLLLLGSEQYKLRDAANIYDRLATAQDNLGQKQPALKNFENALQRHQKAGEQDREGATLNNMGRVHGALGQKNEALQFYKQALDISRKVRNRKGEGTVLNNMGAIYDDLGKWDEALTYFEQALTIRRAVEDREGEGVTLNNLGRVNNALGQKLKSLEHYKQALDIMREVGNHGVEGMTFNNLGLLHNDLGERRKAVEYYEQALHIFRELIDRGREGITLDDLGRTYNDLGEKSKAVKSFEDALVIMREVGNRRGEGVTLNNLGVVYNALGEKSKAVNSFEGALGIKQEVGDREGEGVTFDNLGVVYNSLGEKGKAVKCYEQALGIRREVGDRKGEGTTLNNLGKLYDDLGEKGKAVKSFEDALSIRREVGDREREGMTLNDLGKVYDDLGEKIKAAKCYQEALDISKEVSNRIGEGITLHNIGMIYAAQSRNDVALSCVLLAKKLFEYVESPYNIDAEAQWIANLSTEMGEEPFATLRAQVEPRAEQVVEEAMVVGWYDTLR